MSRRRVYCQHCEYTLSKSAYYRHRRKYFNTLTNQWVKDHTTFSSSESDSDTMVCDDAAVDCSESTSESDCGNESALDYSMHGNDSERGIYLCMPTVD